MYFVKCMSRTYGVLKVRHSAESAYSSPLWKFNGLYACRLNKRDSFRAWRWETSAKTTSLGAKTQNRDQTKGPSFVVFGRRRFCRYTTCFYSCRFVIFVVRCFDWNVRFVRWWLRSAAVWNVTPCSLLEMYHLPEELAASSSWPPPWEPSVLHVEKASEPTCFVSLFYAEGGEAARYFETPVNFCHSTRRLVSEDFNFRQWPVFPETALTVLVA